MNKDLDVNVEKKIISPLIVKEEDSSKRLERIVSVVNSFIKIEDGTGRIILTKKGLGIEKSIVLVLLGKYLYSKFSGSGEGEIDLTTISKTIIQPATSLSLFIGRLIDSGMIVRTSRGKYKIDIFTIDEFLENLNRIKDD